jgi:hypothetical protein
MLHMTPEEHAIHLAAAKQEYDAATRQTISRLEKARRLVEKLEKQLAATQTEYYRRVASLSAAFLGLPAPPEAAADGGRDAKRKRRELDPAVLELSKQLSAEGADFAASDLAEAWNQEHPEDGITESTARGVLERLAKRGQLLVTQEGAGRGKGVPRKYTAV